MKLLSLITIRLSIALSVIIGIWAIFFYISIIDEINDETDDMLENSSEDIIARMLAGEEMPILENGSNNTYYVHKLNSDRASVLPSIQYNDITIFIPEKDEKEPARALKTIFQDSDNNFFELTVLTPTIEKEDLKTSILQWTIILYVALLATLLVINLLIFYKSMKPLYGLLGWLENSDLEKPKEPLQNNTKIKEFQKLNDAVVHYTKRVENSFKQQKQFIGNASHEIQTPLAICQNRLEILVETSNLSEHDLGEILKTKQTLSHIIRLNKTLLFLSKIDNHQFPESKMILFNTIIKELLPNYEELYMHQNITISIREEANFDTFMNETLATTLVSNLIKNMFVHNKQDGSINITIKKDLLLFSNTGDLKPLEGMRIFERFYQGSKKEGSSGLGLAIVKAICSTYSLMIQYHFENGKHNFTLTKQ